MPGWKRAMASVLALWTTGMASAGTQSKMEVWVSSIDMAKTLAREAPLEFGRGRPEGAEPIDIDEKTAYQTVLGIGSSLEHATCFNISLLPPQKQGEVVRKLVDPKGGIGMNLMRICVGTSDFTGDPWYSYDDVPEGQADPELSAFSIEKDRAYLLPILKMARQANRDLLFFASPWSPPAWMKEGGKGMCGGTLKREWYGAYAEYLARFVKAYEAEGVPIYAMTLQNEPGVNSTRYPSCRWSGEQQRDFIRDHVGPVFRQAGIAPRIWCFDHNFNNLPFPRAVLSDPDAAKYVEGTAFHLYEGRPAAMTDLHHEFPDKAVYFSEGSVYDVRGALQIISYFRNWARSYNAWVTVIDQDRKPNNGPHECDPTMILIDSRTKELTYRFEYYMYGHFSRFLQRGAARIASTEGDHTFNNVAFKNPDGSFALIAANDGDRPRRIALCVGNRFTTHWLGPKSVATYTWRP